MLLRYARPSDAPDLTHNCFPEQAPGQVREYLSWCLAQQAKGRIVRLVAQVDGQVVANGQLGILRDRGEIGSLVVAIPYRRNKIGTALIQALIGIARQRQVRTLEITAHTEPPWLQAWYQRLGFVFHKNHVFPGGERVAILLLALAKEIGECPKERA